TLLMPRGSGESTQQLVAKIGWTQETLHEKWKKMALRQSLIERGPSLSKEATDNRGHKSTSESLNGIPGFTGVSSVIGSHRFATTTVAVETNFDKIKETFGKELHESDDVVNKALCASGLSSRKDLGNELLSNERNDVGLKSAALSSQIHRKSKTTLSANGLSSVKEPDEHRLFQGTEGVHEMSSELHFLDAIQMDDQQKLRTRLCSIFDKVLVVDNVTVARKVVHKLTHEYKHHVHACDTEVSNIDVKQETPVNHGEIICFSIYSGEGVDYDSSIKKVWHNYSFDSHVLENYGIKPSGFYADTMHMARLWDSSRRTVGGYSLEALTSNPDVMYANAMGHDDDLMGKISMKTIFGRRKTKKDGSQGKTVSLLAAEELQKEERVPWICYSSLNSMSTLKLYESLESKLLKMPWIMEGEYVENILHFYKNYW
ncbi:hypothetical protein SOVF_204340, partial [Spinacia oleracea]